MKKLFVLFLVCFFILPSVAFGQRETILIIGSYHPEYPWEISYREGINEILGYKYDFVSFYMDTKRLPQSEHEKMAQQAWAKYDEVKPVLVILGDDNALKYLTPKLGETDTPVVYLGVNGNPRDYGAFDKDNITGVLERPLVKKSISILKRIVEPSPKKVLALFDDGPTSKASVAEAFRGQTTLTVQDIQVDLKLIGNLDLWKKTVLDAKKQGYDAIFTGLFHTIRDQQGKHVSDEDVLKWTVENTPLPPFAFWDFIVGKDKAVGGFVLFGKAQGQEAAKLARRILQGKKPSEITPVIGKRGEFLFSRSGLKKWGMAVPTDILSLTRFTD